MGAEQRRRDTGGGECRCEQRVGGGWIEVTRGAGSGDADIRRARRILEPASGERVLVVGPGTGYYTLPVAERLAPEGVIEILDVQRGFLDRTCGAHGRGV